MGLGPAHIVSLSEARIAREAPTIFAPAIVGMPIDRQPADPTPASTVSRPWRRANHLLGNDS